MACLTLGIFTIGYRETRCRKQIHDCTAVVDHKWSLNFITHETFRLEQFDMSPSLHQPFCRKSHMQVDQVTIKLDSATT
jgi:hypothetical protein